jgi:hypothetical protein
MAALQKLQKLSEAHVVLLAIEYATEANMAALDALTALRDSDLPLELVLRILLTYLPEGADPSTYISYLNKVATDARSPGDNPSASLDTSTVDTLSNSQAKRRRRSLELLPLAHALYAAEPACDALTHFLIHRAHRIDAQTGLLDLVPQLVAPFLAHSEYLRTWFIATVLPLLRLSYEYYPQSVTPSLDEFARLRGKRAIEQQFANLRQARRNGAETEFAARDLRGIVAPWMVGASDRKRRRLSGDQRRASVTEQHAQDADDWECLFRWMVHTSKEDLPLVTAAISEWDGPEDMDLGGFDEGRDYVDEETRQGLEVQYAQSALACLYLVDAKDVGALQTAHTLLTRICDLLNCDPPPQLTIGVESLPTYDLKDPLLQDSTTSVLQEERLLSPDNNITRPGRDTVRILELIIFSACVLSTVHHPLSIRELAKMSLRDDYSEQISLLQKILHTLTSESKKDSDQWKVIRSKLLWLWNWGTDRHDNDRHAQGVLGMLERKTVETEILKSLLEGSHFPLVVQTYIKPAFGEQPLLLSDVEQVVLTSAMHHYDNASNGNRTRGGMKRAAEIIAAFTPHFPNSSRFQRTQALLAATHAMSFYSLILQHGVPFQPVSIRVSSDPLSLIRKLLNQNLGSYTKLDDMISIGQNLVISMPATIMDEHAETGPLDGALVEEKKSAAERRVIGMAIDAALEEGDFETAYSYVMNRLNLPSAPAPSTRPLSLTTNPDDTSDSDDVAWRAALRAGRFNPPITSSAWSQPNRAPLRRLEQRMDLLSSALLLAPPAHLEQVLSVWLECETEMTSLLAAEADADLRFNDAANRRSGLPGTFDADALTLQPQRREMGRGAAEEAPMGLFDVARGAAAAFSKSAFPLGKAGGGGGGSVEARGSMDGRESRASMDLSESGHDERVRKRDLIANTASGALASGLGWVLGKFLMSVV